MESVKETASNVAATARSGLEKTKASLQGQGEKMTAHTNVDKQMAEQRKHDRIAASDFNKNQAKAQNAAQRTANTGTGTGTGTGEQGYTAGPHQMSAMPGQPAGGRVVVDSHPTGTTTSTTPHNTRSGAGTTAPGPVGHKPVDYLR